MFRRCSVSLLGFVFSFLTFSAFGQPITVERLTNRTTIVTAAQSFRVPTIPGHSYLVLLDGNPIPAGVTNRVTSADYHELSVTRTNVNTGEVASELVQFIIASPNRSTSSNASPPENGLVEWTPYPLIPSTASEFAGATLKLMMPQDYPADLEIPVIARVEDASGNERRGNGFVTSGGYPPIKILRGHGSGFLPSAAPGSPVEYSANLTSLGTYKEVNVDLTTAWTPVSGTLSGAVNWPANSRIHVTGGITIPAGSTLTIGPGTVVRLNPLVNITNSGSTVINGTADQPVVFTSTNRVMPQVRTYAWGGFFLRGSAAELIANGAIFVGGGGAASISFTNGSSHRSEQAVFLIHSGARAFLTNCAVINTAGQVANGYNSDVTYDHCLLQRAITAGEYVGGTIIVNHSALIEFPEDNDVINAAIADADYDAIYFTTGTHILMNSLFGFCKDDATDSGSGGGGTVLVTNCWYESALHEANAWSNDSGVRDAQTYNSVLMNSGQGFECGWSGAANSPLCSAGNILSIGNSVGARFGDNYPSIASGLLGFLRVTNSYVLNNYRDVWGMQWRNDSTGWYYRSNQMDIRNNFITQANAFHPTNSIWNPPQDGPRLAGFMTTPPNAPVGIGFATWTNQFAMTAIFGGIPVRLSSFTTNSVSVDYALESGPQVLQTGTLTFQAGEMVKRIFPAGFNLQSYTQVRVVLSNPVRGELTGQTQVNFQGGVPAAQMYAFVPGAQLDHARIREGFPVALTAPAAHSISVNYAYEVSPGIISSGLLTFAPGQTLAWVPAPAGAQVEGWDIVRFRLSNPGAPFLGPSTIYYVKAPAGPPTPPPVTLIARGSDWRYPNVAGALPDTWKTSNYSDASWLSGPTELGFGDGDEARAITRFASQITYYFRKTFPLDDPSVFANLSMWLLRDDGAVVYFNGTEVFRSSSLPQPPAIITATTTTATGQNDNVVETATLGTSALIPDVNLIAVEMHQQDTGSSDLSFNFELIANHAPPFVAQRVYMAKFDGQLTFGWSDPTYVLKQAPTVTGPWTTAATTSPFFVTPNPNIPQQFFQLQK
jgi:hypothetical protein